MFSHYLAIHLHGLNQPLFFEVSPGDSDEVRAMLGSLDGKSRFWSVDTKDGRETAFSLSRLRKVEFLDEPLYERHPPLENQHKELTRIALEREPELLSFGIDNAETVAGLVSRLYEKENANFILLDDEDESIAINPECIIFVDVPSAPDKEA